jgi:hypothetical protein
MAKKTFNEGIAKNYRETCHACKGRVKSSEASYDDNGNAYCSGCFNEQYQEPLCFEEVEGEFF